MTGTGGNTIRGVCLHNFNAAVQIESNDNHLEGCFIGTDPTGTAGPGNGTGIVITAGASGNVIGGATAGAGNLISGNATGIQSTGGGANVIQGNLIGTDVTGNAAIANGEGISLTGTTGFLIGGPNPGEGNVDLRKRRQRHPRLGGQRVHDPGKQDRHERGGDGVPAEQLRHLLLERCRAGDRRRLQRRRGQPDLRQSLDGISIAGSIGTVVKGNTIGTDPAATQPLGNGGAGVYLDQNSTDALIGGVASGEANAIAWNQNGVYNLGVRNAIRANPIFFNQLLGIDNDPAGVTKNDPLDADTGANQLQNFPLRLDGRLRRHDADGPRHPQVEPGTTFDLDFYEIRPARRGRGTS